MTLAGFDPAALAAFSPEERATLAALVAAEAARGAADPARAALERAMAACVAEILELATMAAAAALGEAAEGGGCARHLEAVARALGEPAGGRRPRHEGQHGRGGKATPLSEAAAGDDGAAPSPWGPTGGELFRVTKPGRGAAPSPWGPTGGGRAALAAQGAAAAPPTRRPEPRADIRDGATPARRTRRAPTAALLAAVLATTSCAPAAALLDPPLAQLARWQTAAPEAIATEPVAPCDAANPACATLHLRRAEACAAVALASRAPGAACPARAGTLPCAAEHFSRARALGAAPASPNEPLALLCLAELSAPAEGAALARRAEAATRDPLLRARAALLRARPGAAPGDDGGDWTRCAAARAALAEPATPPRERADLRARLATIPGCQEGPAR